MKLTETSRPHNARNLLGRAVANPSCRLPTILLLVMSGLAGCGERPRVTEGHTVGVMRTVAVTSVTETGKPKPVFFFGIGWYRGTLYLELFDASSRAKLGAAETGWRGPVPFLLASWIESRAFVLPLDLRGQTWLVALSPMP